jgi:hypothetical protein
MWHCGGGATYSQHDGSDDKFDSQAIPTGYEERLCPY